MARYDAYIVYHNGEYIVRPAFAVMQVPGKFRICNMTDIADAEVTLPLSRVKRPDVNKKTTGLRNSQYVVDFELDGPAGTFGYQVTVDGYVANGESDPVIIIDP